MDKKYIIRLDDACEHMDLCKWQRMEQLLDKYGIKPIVSIIPCCQDESLTSKYSFNTDFWNLAMEWQAKGWTIGLHGFNHVYLNFNAKGLNPINSFSEFVDLSLSDQEEKIRLGIVALKSHGINPVVFVAPGHSFDENTLLALKKQSDIRVVSDTIAYDKYIYKEFVFIPQQCGAFKNLPFKTITGCFHPNTMANANFDELETFLKKHQDSFSDAGITEIINREYSKMDQVLKSLYFLLRVKRKKKEN